MEVVVDGARVAFVTTLALTLTTSVYMFPARHLPREITRMMTGKDQSAARADVTQPRM